MNFKRVIIWCVAVAFVLGGAYVGRSIPFEKQWPLFEALRTTAAIIFAVVGAWMAIVYPERMRLSFRSGTRSADADQQGLGRFFTPVAHSTGVLCAILILGVLAPLLKQWDLLLRHVELVRGVSYGLLISLTLFQLCTVVLTLLPADIIKSNADHEDDQRRRQHARDILISSTSALP